LGPVAVLLLLLYPAILCEKMCGFKKKHDVKSPGMTSRSEIALNLHCHEAASQPGHLM